MKKLLLTVSVLSTFLLSIPSFSSPIIKSSPILHKARKITIIDTAKNNNNFTQVKSVALLSGKDACKNDVNAKGKFCFPIHNANKDATINFLDNESFIFSDDIPPNSTGGLLITTDNPKKVINLYSFKVAYLTPTKDGKQSSRIIFTGDVKNQVGITCDSTSCEPWTD